MLRINKKMLGAEATQRVRVADSSVEATKSTVSRRATKNYSILNKIMTSLLMFKLKLTKKYSSNLLE